MTALCLANFGGVGIRTPKALANLRRVDALLSEIQLNTAGLQVLDRAEQIDKRSDKSIDGRRTCPLTPESLQTSTTS
jgi:hypothetical protein